MKFSRAIDNAETLRQVAGALAIESNPGRWATSYKGSAEEHRLRFLLRLTIFQPPHGELHLIIGTKEQHDPPVRLHLGQQVDRLALMVNPVYALGESRENLSARTVVL